TFASIGRRWIPRCPEGRFGRRIIRAGDPRRGAPNFPGLAFPAFVTRFTRTRNGVEAPFAFAGICVVRVDESANAILTAADPDYDQIFNRQRRQRDAVALGVIESGHIPHNVAGLGIERDYVRIQSAQKNLISENGQTSIDAPAAWPNVRWQQMLVLPNRPARTRVQSESAIVLARAIQHAVDNQRRGLEFSAGHGLVCPLWHQRMRVGRIDLVERTEPAAS